MKKLKQSSVSAAWLTRAKSIVAPAAARPSGDRFDLVLPRGWPESGSPVFWRWHKRGAQAESGQAADLRHLPDKLLRIPAHVWTPAADTMLTSAILPTRSRRKIMQALPYALEDRLLGDPESLHFAYRNESDGSLSVAISARERLRVWMEALAQAGIQPAVLCPATLMVPWALDCWSLAFVTDEILVRTGSAYGFVTPFSQDPPSLLIASTQEAARSQKMPEYLVVFSPPSGFSAESWGEKLQAPVRVEKTSLWDRPEDPVAPLNLLQGQFEPKGQLNSSLRPYLPAAAMLLIWLLGNVGFDLGEWWKLRRQHQEYSSEMNALLLSTFPETKTVLDPAAQMQRSIDNLLAKTGHRDRDLLPLLTKTATAMRSDNRVRLRGIRYADQSLTLELSWPAPANPDTLKSALEAVGVRTEVLAMTPRANDVDGRFRLQPAPKPGKAPS